MPFQSKRQMRYLYAKEPEVAKKFADHTSKKQLKNLPEQVPDEPKSKNQHMKELSKQHMRKKEVR